MYVLVSRMLRCKCFAIDKRVGLMDYGSVANRIIINDIELLARLLREEF